MKLLPCIHCGQLKERLYRFEAHYENGDLFYSLCEICYPTLLRIVQTYARAGYPEQAFDYEMNPQMGDPIRYGLPRRRLND